MRARRLKEIADRLHGVSTSNIVHMRREAERLGAINLASGTCELPAPIEVLRAAAEAIERGMNMYSFPEGVPELRRAIVAKLLRDNGLTVDRDTEVTVTVGATGGYFCAVMGLLDPGDEIILLEPFYGWHRSAAAIAGLGVAIAPLEAPRFRLEASLLADAVSDRTRAIVVTSPSNPTGRVLDDNEFAVLADFAEAHDLLVIADEVYEYLVFDGRRHRSLSSHPRLAPRTVTLMGFSKTFHVTGWRVGYAVGPAALVAAMRTVHDFMCTCAPTPLQKAAVAALSLPNEYFARLRVDYQRRRDILVEALLAAGLEPLVPEGAYYVLANSTKFGVDSAEAAAELLRRTRVAAVPASAFYAGGRAGPFLRFCFARDETEFDEACRRLRTLS